MADFAETPAPVAGPITAIVASLLSPHLPEVGLVVRLGWEAAPNGTLLPIQMVVVRRA